MRIRSILGTLVIASLPVMPALAADMTPEEIQKMVDEAVNRKMQEHERREGAAERSTEQKEGAPQFPVPTGPMSEVRVERKGEEKVPLGFGSTGSGRLVYAKPFVAAPKAIVGGYMDIQYRTEKQASIENGYGGTTNTFDQQRFVPFIYADITEHVKFASEIEIEHGIREDSTQGLEIGLEFAHIDYLVNEPFNIRAGILLLPVGKFNLLHDSPLNDLTDRPLVARFVIPSTMSETGSGYYGNGAPNTSYNSLSILAFDWTLQRGPFELIGEAAWSYARQNSRAINGNTIGFAPGSLLTGIAGNSGPGTPPQRSSGYYIQANYHFMPAFLAKWSPKRFGEGSTFTAVFRYDRVNTNLDDSNGTGGWGNLEQYSFGLNYRPIEDCAFKMSYQYQPMAFNPNTEQRIHNQAFVISAATYF